MMKQTKRFFTQNSAFYMNNPDNPDLKKIKTELRHLEDKKEELLDELEILQSDQEATKVHRLALVKKENNQMLNQNEENAMSKIKENYSTFFEEQLEESDPEVETSPEYKERKQVKDVAEYLKQEIYTAGCEYAKNETELAETNSRYEALENELSNTKSTAESSTSVKARDLTEKSEASNKTSELTSQSEPSKQSAQINQNTGDYIDNLPKEYNPLDDLGSD